MGRDTLAAKVKEINGQIELLLNRVVNAGGQSLARADEAKIEERDKKKLLLADQAAQAVPPMGRFDDSIESTMPFPESP